MQCDTPAPGPFPLPWHPSAICAGLHVEDISILSLSQASPSRALLGRCPSHQAGCGAGAWLVGGALSILVRSSCAGGDDRPGVWGIGPSLSLPNGTKTWPYPFFLPSPADFVTEGPSGPPCAPLAPAPGAPPAAADPVSGRPFPPPPQLPRRASERQDRAGAPEPAPTRPGTEDTPEANKGPGYPARIRSPRRPNARLASPAPPSERLLIWSNDTRVLRAGRTSPRGAEMPGPPGVSRAVSALQPGRGTGELAEEGTPRGWGSRVVGGTPWKAELKQGDTPGVPWVGRTPLHPRERPAACILERRFTKLVVVVRWPRGSPGHLWVASGMGPREN